MTTSIKPVPLSKLVTLVPTTRASTDSELASIWLQRFKSPHTRRAYQFDLGLFGREVGLGLHELKVEDLINYRDRLAKSVGEGGLGFSVPRQRRALTAIKSLLTFGEETGYLPLNVGTVVELPEAEDKLAQRIVSESEMLTLLHLTREPREKAMLNLLYSSALRVSELCWVRWKHLTRKGEVGYLSVKGKGDQYRTVLIPSPTLALLDSIRNGAPEDCPIFPTRTGRAMLPVQVWRIAKRRAKEAGLSSRFSPHFFRHAHVSHSLDNGASPALVIKTTGHKSLDTLTRYAHARANEGSGMYLKVA